MSRQRKKPEESKVDSSAWLATFSDLNFLMITFFVLLLSMSSMDDRRYTDVFGEELSMAQDMVRPTPPMGKSPLPIIIPASGRWVGHAQQINVKGPPGKSGGQKAEGNDELQKGRRSLLGDPEGKRRDELLRKLLERSGDLVALEPQEGEQFRLAVEDSLFFKQGEFQPDPGADEFLRSMARLANDLGGRLVVEAHKGSWELASRRSAAVARLLVRHGVPGERVAADVVAGPENQLNFALTRPISNEQEERGNDG